MEPYQDQPQSRTRLCKSLDLNVCFFGFLSRQRLLECVEPYEVSTSDDFKGWEEGVQSMPLDVLSKILSKR